MSNFLKEVSGVPRGTALASGDLPTISLTGDITGSASGGSIATTLATVNTNTGSFGSSTAIPNFTVNGKGLITAAGTNAVVAPAGTLSGTTLNSTVVTSSLTALGTIATGVWQGTAIGPTFGGTGQTTYTTGDILYASASNTLSKLPIGSTNQVLTVVSGIPAWAAAGGGGGGGIGSAGVSTIATNHVIVTGDEWKVFLVQTTSGAYSLTLPSPTSGFAFSVKDSQGNAGTNNITLLQHASESIEGVAASFIMSANWGTWTFISDGTNWFIMGH